MHSWGNTCSERLNRAWGEPKTRERDSRSGRISSRARKRSCEQKGKKEGRKEEKKRKGEKIEESDGGEGESLRNGKISSAKCQLMTN